MENEKIGKLEKAFRPVLDLSCFRFISFFFMTRAFKGHEVVPLRGVVHKRIRPGSSRRRFHLLSICGFCLSYFFYFFFPPPPLRHVYLPVPQLRERRVHRRSFEIRGQIAAAELSTCLATGWMPAVHIDPRRGPGVLSWTHLDIAGVMKCFFFFSVFIKKSIWCL